MRVSRNVAAQEILSGRGSASDDRQKLHEKDDYPLRRWMGSADFQPNAPRRNRAGKVHL